MMGRSHLTHGAAVGAWYGSAAAAVGVPDELAVLAVALTAYSALWPDLDHPRSLATYSLGPVTIAVSWVLRLFFDHRQETHAPRAALAFAAPVALGLAFAPAPVGGWSAFLWFGAVAAGILTHIWGDARTLSGTPWRGRWVRWEPMGWPVARTNGGRLRLGRVFRTGSDWEVRLRHLVYQPVAVASLVGAFLVVGGTG
jgi:membrane-bound metal-dependent hydrolase YbcI (DUF457 family)